MSLKFFKKIGGRIMSKVWFISGTSTGFGRQFVEQLLQTDNKIIATARNIEAIADFKLKSPDNVHIVALYVTNRTKSNQQSKNPLKYLEGSILL
jgi:NADP-dependent 3-hydroxy acid dehydrogenase YdfG